MAMSGKFKITVDTASLSAGDSLAAYLTSAAGVLLTHSTVTPGVHAAFTFAPGDVDTATDTITEAGHNLETGDILQFSTSGTLPTGLAVSTNYYVIRTSSSTFKVASSLANAEAGTAIDLTAQGTGTHTATEQESPVKALNVRLAGLEKLEDEPHISGAKGLMSLAVRNDTEGALVSANGDYAPLQVDSLGRLRVVSDINVNNDFVYAEDSAASSGDLGASILMVRQDTLASSTSLDGDYAHFKGNASGELYVVDATGRTTLSSILTELQALTQAEDVAHVSGDLGVMSLGVRRDTRASGTSLDGDYATINLNSVGELWVKDADTYAELQTQGTTLSSILTELQSLTFAEDVAHTTGDLGIQALAVRKDASGSNAADGDYTSLLTWSEGSLKVVNVSNASMLQQLVSVASTATALPTTALANRRSILVQNTGSASFYVGSATVTSSGATKGIEVPKGGHIELEAGPSVSVYAITASGTVSAAILEMA